MVHDQLSYIVKIYLNKKLKNKNLLFKVKHATCNEKCIVMLMLIDLCENCFAGQQDRVI